MCLPRLARQAMELRQVWVWPSASSETFAPPLVRDFMAAATSGVLSELMVWSAPRFLANLSVWSSMSTASTCAPLALAIMMADRPTPPQPWTATQSP